VSNVFHPVTRYLRTALGGALPTALRDHRGMFAIKQAASTSDELYVGVLDSSAVMQWRQVIVASSSGGSVSLPTNGRLTLGGGGVLISGTGDPNGAFFASVGALFLRTDGGASTTLYVKESGTGNTGWVAK
jgi:hypothetical protein